MSRLSFLLVILAILAITVSAVKVDVEVNVGGSSEHHMRPHHKNHHNEHHEESAHVPEHLMILPESEVDEAEAEVDEAAAHITEGEVPSQPGKAPEKSHVTITESDMPVVGGGTNHANDKCSMNTAGTSLVKSFEGFVGHWYNDGTGVMTIGYGCTSECKGMKTITEPEAAKKLQQLLNGQYGACVRRVITRKLTTNEFAALTSFVYNVGCGGLSGSVGQAVNRGDLKGAMTHLASWNRGGGRVLAGLVRRRSAEVKLFNTKSALC